MKHIYLNQQTKFLSGCDIKTGKRIIDAINKIPTGDIKQLKGMKITAYRLIVGKIRIIYVIEKDTIVISKIDYRGDIYK